MTIYLYKTSTPGTHNGAIDSQVKSNPRNNLIYGQHHCGKGHNSRGIITARHRGGGHQRLYHIYGRIVTIEYNPNRNAYICLIHYGDGEKRYILHPRGKRPLFQREEDRLFTFHLMVRGELKAKQWHDQHNIEITLGRRGQLARAPGKTTILKLHFGEVRLISKNCSATKSLGRSGSKCWLGKLLVVRGVVMNPVDHPHGSGEGRVPIGRKKPATLGVILHLEEEVEKGINIVII
ncbi:hypothetical protein V6Z11_D08G210900 [Gossypium hirsutum]